MNQGTKSVRSNSSKTSRDLAKLGQTSDQLRQQLGDTSDRLRQELGDTSDRLRQELVSLKRHQQRSVGDASSLKKKINTVEGREGRRDFSICK